MFVFFLSFLKLLYPHLLCFGTGPPTRLPRSVFVIYLGGLPADCVCHGNWQRGNRSSHLHFLPEVRLRTSSGPTRPLISVCVCVQTCLGCTKLSAWIMFKQTATLPNATGLHFMLMRRGLGNRLLVLSLSCPTLPRLFSPPFSFSFFPQQQCFKFCLSPVCSYHCFG